MSNGFRSSKSDSHHNRKWTYDICRAIAGQYEWLSDFRHFDRKCYDACMSNRWLEDFGWLKRDKGHVPVKVAELDIDECQFSDSIPGIEEYIIENILPNVDMDRFCDLFFDYYEKWYNENKN